MHSRYIAPLITSCSLLLRALLSFVVRIYRWYAENILKLRWTHNRNKKPFQSGTWKPHLHTENMFSLAKARFHYFLPKRKRYIRYMQHNERTLVIEPRSKSCLAHISRKLSNFESYIAHKRIGSRIRFELSLVNTYFSYFNSIFILMNAQTHTHTTRTLFVYLFSHLEFVIISAHTHTSHTLKN